MATDEGLLARFRNAKRVNRTFYTWVVITARNIALWLCRVKIVNRNIIPYNKPYLIVANHVALLDPAWVYSAARGSLHPVATEDLFRKPILNRIVYWCGAFPKRKAALDLSTIKNMRKILTKLGRPVIVFPEGVRTWDGRLCPIPDGIGTLIRIMKVPVFGARQEGAYLAQPRWARKYRPFPLTITFKKLYNGDDLPKENASIVKTIADFLETDDYAINFDEKKYRRSGLARDVTILLYRCPNCRTWEGLKITRPYRTNQIQCASCFSSWRLTPLHRLIPLDANGRAAGDRIGLDVVYRQIRDFPLEPMTTSLTLDLEDGEVLHLTSGRHVLRREEVFPQIREIAVGRLYLTNRRLIFRSRDTIVLNARVEELKGISAEAGNRFNFVYQSRIYNITFRTESILKWFDTIHRVGDALSEAK